jgi:hypothetical protein
VLLLGAAAPLAACALFDDEPAAAPTHPPPHPDDIVRDRATAAEGDLLSWYDAVTTEHPELAEPLAPFRQRHERHLTAVRATAHPVDPTATPSPGRAVPPPPVGSPAESPPATPPPVVSTDPAEAIRELRDAESGAAGDRLTDCLAARDGRLAALLAGIAACESTHDQLLGAVPT